MMPSIKRRWLKTTLSRAATTFDRSNRPPNLLLLAIFCIAAVAMPGCAGVTSTGPSVVTVVLQPTQVSVPLSQSQQFQATVTGTSNKSVTWFVGGVAGGSASAGTISPSGLYTAPNSMPSPATVTVTASSNADSSCHGVGRRHAHRRNRNRDLAHFRHGLNWCRTSISQQVSRAQVPLRVRSPGASTASLEATRLSAPSLRTEPQARSMSLPQFRLRLRP